MSSQIVLFEKRNKVGLITLNHPETMNALSEALVQELVTILEHCETDPRIHCMVLTGSEKAFCGGANLAELQAKTITDVQKNDFIKNWEKVSACRKPIIAAVSGYALGGGCEIAMMCDIILASDTAQFGQPEVKLGTLPGAGGTQRLPRAIGKSKAMELCLTGRRITAEEAEKAGLVSRVVLNNQLLTEALQMAETIASYSLPVVMMIKESITQAFETSLSEGLQVERNLFHSTFALEDQKEGIAAFLEKRKPAFKNK